MSKVPVMVTGVGGGGVGEQILKALRMSSLDYFIVGGDMNKNSKGFTLVDKPYILPPASSDHYIETLLAICKKHGIKALFYGSEPELKKMSIERENLLSNDIFVPLNPKHVIDICMDKNRTMEWFLKNGIATPKSVTVTCKEDLDKIEFLPAVLKPSVGAGGSANTFISQSEGELRMFGNYMLGIYDEFIAQEYVGSYDSEYTVGILTDMTGKYINKIAVKRNILSGLSSKTKIRNCSGNAKYGDYLVISSGVSQGEIGRYSEITDVCKDIALKLGCTGPINLQCRVQDNKVYVFEINPRISGTTSLRALVGYNEPDAMIRKHVLGEDLEVDFEYGSGYIARGLDESLISTSFMNSIEIYE